MTRTFTCFSLVACRREFVTIDRRSRRWLPGQADRTSPKDRLAEIHATSMKRLSKIEAADDPSDGADDE
jgi:single-strand DNA-binding protein